ncbi:acetolactate synthase 3 large subunit [Kordiimonas sediminis]
MTATISESTSADSAATDASTTQKGEILSGAQMIVRALTELGVDTIFGYPGGAVLPIYDELFKQNKIRHILVRHEQGATHAAEGYARTTGKPGVVLVTSGPGATNAVTGLTDAMLDSIPLICLTGQVARALIGNDAFQEADTVGITRPCTKHSYLVKETAKLPKIIYEAFWVAENGRPGPVVIDLPKDVQVEKAEYIRPNEAEHRTYHPQTVGEDAAIKVAIERLRKAKRPILYTGGGVINAGPEASKSLYDLAKKTNAPVTNTLMGLGAYPASDKQFLGMLGMHGTWEANHAMHDCDVMVCVGARFDDRVTGNIEQFSPGSFKIHIDIDLSSINKNVHVDLPIVGDAGVILKQLLAEWDAQNGSKTQPDLTPWWNQIERWRDRKCLSYKDQDDVIMPQKSLERLYELTKHLDPVVSTEVGQHQMWAAQFYGFDKPNRWLTSGGLGTMGYGFPAAVGAQIADPDRLVICIAGDASIQMNIQELSTAVQHNANVKIFIMNNEYMGMVRQWQDLNYDGRYSHSYSDSLPDFVKLAEAYGCTGLRVSHPDELDDTIRKMVETPGPVVVDCCVAKLENCFPMFAAGAKHTEIILSSDEIEPKDDSVIAMV